MAKGVYIDEEECIGCETCVELCPDVFEFDDDEGKARVTNPTGASEEDLEEAIDTCPAECIHWQE